MYFHPQKLDRNTIPIFLYLNRVGKGDFSCHQISIKDFVVPAMAGMVNAIFESLYIIYTLYIHNMVYMYYFLVLAYSMVFPSIYRMVDF